MPDPAVPRRGLTPEEEAVLSDELLRERIRQIRGESRPPSRWEKMSRHPLTAALTGFFLTGVLGLFLSQSVNAAREGREQRLEDYRTDLASDRRGLEEFASRLFERHTLGTRFLNALDRGALRPEVDARRAEYEESVARWGTGLPTSLFMIRRVMRADSYTDVEQVVEGRLDRRFEEADSLLLAAYYRSSAGERAGDLSAPREAFDQALNCGAQVTETLHRAISERGPPPDEPGIATRILSLVRARGAADAEAQLLGTARPDYLKDLEEMCPR